MSAKEKIAEILAYLNINAKAFSEMLGYQRPQIIYDIQKGKTKNLSGELASKIISVFPQINRVWLLTGEGEMLLGGKVDEKSDETVTINAQAWDVIRRQSESLASRDRQIDELISLLKDQMQEIKKTSAPQEGRASCADAG